MEFWNSVRSWKKQRDLRTLFCMLGHEKRTKGLLLVPRADLSPKGDFYKENKTAALLKNYCEKNLSFDILLPHSNDGKCPAGSKGVKQRRSKIATASIFKTRLKLYAILALKKKVLKMRSNAKVLRFHCNKCNAISENYSEKNFCLLTFASCSSCPNLSF